MVQKKDLSVVTMVRGDYHWARLWRAHYQAHVESARDLYVIIHGEDAVLEEIFMGCSILHVPLEAGGVDNFEQKRLDFEHFLIRGLQAYFKCVLLVDIDELVTPAPDIDQPLWYYLSQVHQGEMVRSALGLEVVDRPEDNNQALDLDAPLLAQRPWAYCNGQYSKPCAFYFNFGAASHHRVWGAPWVIDPNLLLFHLRYCDQGLLNQYAHSRKRYFQQQVAAGSASSGSWRSPWREYKMLTSEVSSRQTATFDAAQRHALRKYLLDRFRENDRVGRVASGYLRLPDEYHQLLPANAREK